MIYFEVLPDIISRVYDNTAWLMNSDFVLGISDDYFAHDPATNAPSLMSNEVLW